MHRCGRVIGRTNQLTIYVACLTIREELRYESMWTFRFIAFLRDNMLFIKTTHFNKLLSREGGFSFKPKVIIFFGLNSFNAGEVYLSVLQKANIKHISSSRITLCYIREFLEHRHHDSVTPAEYCLNRIFTPSFEKKTKVIMLESENIYVIIFPLSILHILN